MLSSQCEQAVQRVSPIFGTESRCHFLGLEARLPLPNQNNMEHTRSGMVWTAPLRTNQVWFGFPEYCSQCIGSISKPAQKSFCVNMAWIVHYFVEWGTITWCDLSRRFFCIDATLLGTTLQCLASKKHLLVSATWYWSSISESNIWIHGRIRSTDVKKGMKPENLPHKCRFKRV